MAPTPHESASSANARSTTSQDEAASESSQRDKSSNRSKTSQRCRVVVIGGGLAGTAAALALAENGFRVTLLEARRRLGGRAGSFATGSGEENEETIDYCQHVGMGCCHNLQRLIRSLGEQDAWEEQSTLHFYGPDGRYVRLAALPWTPAPLHIGHWLWKWPGLRFRDRLAVARGMLSVASLRLERDFEELDRISALQWLHDHGQTQTAIDRFWSTIIVSALGEETRRVSLAAVGKVLQDGFLRKRGAFHLLVPKQPLDILFNERAQQKLRAAGVEVRLSTAARAIDIGATSASVCTSSEELQADHVVVAVPWHKVNSLKLRVEGEDQPPLAPACAQLEASPITGIHSWWDRPWLPSPHAAVVGRLCQWVFPKGSPANSAQPKASNDPDPCPPKQEVYYQIVISASRQLQGQQQALQAQLVEDLSQVFPDVRSAQLLRYQVVTDPNSVFSTACGSYQLRADMRTQYSILWLAGDWTRTGWPATMEGAILSGYRVAEAIVAQTESTR